MKTKEELNALKEEFENLNKKLNELSEEELEKVSGGKTNTVGVIPIIFAQTIMQMPLQIEPK